MTVEQIKKIRRKKKFVQEDHKDDSGSDFSPLESNAWMTTLGADGSLGVAIDYGFNGHQECCPSFAESSGDDLERIFNDNFGLSYLVGSGGGLGDRLDMVVHVPIEQFVGYFERPELAGDLDVVESFWR